MEHSHCVTVLTHALVTIHNEVFGGKADVLKAVMYATYHEVSEVLTGDLPTPIKYYNQSIHSAYKQMEKSAGEKIASSLPEEMRPALSQYIMADEQSEEYVFVKAADKLAAYVKCLEELRSGNMEFSKAKKSIEKELRARKIPEVEYFFKYFIPSFELTLDELETL